MNYLYILGSALTALISVGTWLFRRRQKALNSQASSLVRFASGNIRLRIGSLFSRILATQLAARRYAKYAHERSPSTVSVPSVQNVQLRIDSIYVDLSLKSGDQITTTSTRSLVSRAGPTSVFLFGEPGSGKSTLTRHLFREQCRNLHDFPSSEYLPVYLELRKIPWAEAPLGYPEGNWLRNIISTEIDSLRSIHSDGFLFDAFVRGHGLLVILDGLDEVPSNHLAKSCQEIAGVVKDLAGVGSSRVLVTGRTQLRAVMSRQFLDSFDDVFTVQPFSQENVFSFLRKWPFPGRVRSEEIARVFSAIQSSASLQEMCTNPLVLSMYVARDQLYVERSGRRPVRLPDTRTDFYQEIVNELLLFRRSEQVETSPAGSDIKRRRENLLGKISLVHLSDREQPTNSVPWDLAVDITRGLLGLDERAAETELRRIAIETGIFNEERRGESLRFLHLTICEYLAAKELRESEFEHTVKVMQELSQDNSESRPRRLLEVAIFAASLVGRAARRQILRDALADFDSPIALCLRIVHENSEHADEVLPRIFDRIVSVMRASTSLYEGWENDIRLLMSCLSGATDGSPGQSNNTLTTNDVVHRIVDREKLVSFSNIFSVCLNADPALAIAEATSRGLGNQLLTVPVLVEALQESAVVLYAIENMHGSSDLWPIALSEAALSYPLVAQVLSETEPGLPLSAPSGDDWTILEPLRGNLYGEAIQRAAALQESHGPFVGMKLGLLLWCKPSRLIRESNIKLMELFNLSERSELYTRRDGLARPGMPMMLGRKIKGGQFHVCVNESAASQALISRPASIDLEVSQMNYRLYSEISISNFLLRCIADDCLVPLDEVKIFGTNFGGFTDSIRRRTMRSWRAIFRRRDG